jgi:hypothetical protein
MYACILSKDCLHVDMNVMNISEIRNHGSCLGDAIRRARSSMAAGPALAAGPYFVMRYRREAGQAVGCAADDRMLIKQSSG